jgi:hypothetical protein
MYVIVTYKTKEKRKKNMTQLLAANGNYSSITLPYPMGFDGGNEDTCAAIIDQDGRERVVVLPSVMMEFTNNKLGLLKSGMHGSNEQTDPYKQDVEVHYRGHHYMVGYMTYVQNRDSNPQRGDESRYSSVEQVIRCLVSSGLLISDPEYQIDLITTVPVKYYSNKLRLDVRNALEGEHEFDLNGVSRKATIHVLKVMVEGPPAMALYGAGTAKARRLIIDGGRHTTELLTLNGRDPIASLCRGIEVGVQLIADYLYDRVAEMYSRRLSAREISDIIRAYGSRMSATPQPYPDIACGAYVLTQNDLAALTKSGAKLLTDELLKEAGSLWGNINGAVAGDIAHQYMMGGMPFFIAEEMKAKMPLLTVVSDPEQANARGCAQVARAMKMRG